MPTATSPARIETLAGTVRIDVPKTAGDDGQPFHPQSPKGGCCARPGARRQVRALMPTVAEVYLKGGSPCKAGGTMRGFGIDSPSPAHGSRAA